MLIEGSEDFKMTTTNFSNNSTKVSTFANNKK